MRIDKHHRLKRNESIGRCLIKFSSDNRQRKKKELREKIINNLETVQTMHSSLKDKSYSTRKRQGKYHNALEEIKKRLRDQYPASSDPLSHPNAHFIAETDETRSELARKIDALRVYAISYLDGDQREFKMIKLGHPENLFYVPDEGVKLKSLKDYETITSSWRQLRIKRSLVLWSRISFQLRSDSYQTKRKLYYKYKWLFGKSQTPVDDLLDDTAACFSVPRICLHVLPTIKGEVAGDIQIKYVRHDEDTGRRYLVTDDNWSSKNQRIENPAAIMDMKSTAQYCLVIEKEAVYSDMIRNNVHKKLNCILITGRGVPDHFTRQFVSLIWKFLGIPIFCLVDGDPRGIEIMCIYRFGSGNCAYDVKNLATPQMRWLGLFPSDLDNPLYAKSFETIHIFDNLYEKSRRRRRKIYQSDDDDDDDSLAESDDDLHQQRRRHHQDDQVDDNTSVNSLATERTQALTEKLTEDEIKVIRSLLKKPFTPLHPRLEQELQLMLRTKRKVGLELLSRVNDTWLWDVYIPTKICALSDSDQCAVV